MDQMMEQAARQFAEAVRIMARLRGPGGCPWDREQNFDTIKKYTLEETYEVFDAIERRNWPDLKDELGDLLLQVLFYAQMAGEAGDFTIADVVENLNAKLVRRHPHVFGEAEAETSAEVLRHWERVKQAEKAGKLETTDSASGRKSLLDDVPRTMPAMMEAGKLGSRAAKVGFDWPEDGLAAGLFAKLAEETEELRAEVTLRGQGAENAEALAGEFGDLLFTMANLARHLKVDAESALRGTNARFRSRFGAMEQAHAEQIGNGTGESVSLSTLSADELEVLWQQAKQRERK